MIYSSSSGACRGGRRHCRVVVKSVSLFFIALACFSPGVRLAGQQAAPRFRHLRIPQITQPPKTIFLTQDHNGFIWFCLPNGLVRFNGHTFRNFEHDPQNPDSPAASAIRAIHQTRDGRLWIGTFGAGLDRFEPETGKWTHHRFDPKDPNSLSNDSIWTITEDREGGIWIGTVKGLNRFEPGKNRWTRYYHTPGAENSLSDDVVYSLCLDQRGFLWAGTKNGGLNCLDPERKRWIHYGHDPANAGTIGADNVPALLEDREGRIWAGTTGGVCRFDRERSRWRVYKHDPRNPSSIGGDVVIALLQDREGTIWAGTITGGLCRWDGSRDTWITYKHDKNNPDSLASDTITSLCQDRGGIIWIGTYGDGPDQLVPAANQWQLIRPDPLHPDTREQNMVQCAIRDSSGRLWLGTVQGILGYDPLKNLWTRYRHDPANDASPRDDYIVALLLDSRDLLWIGTYSGGVCLFDPRSRSWLRLPGNEAKSGGFLGTHVRQIMEDRAGAIWISTFEAGVNRYDRRAKSWTHFRHDAQGANSLSSDAASSICEDRQGQIWVGTDSCGINRFDPGSRRWTRFEADVNAGVNIQPDILGICEDSRGDLWANSGNLLRFDRGQGRWFKYKENDRSWGDVEFEGLTADKTGHLWLSADQGLFRIDPASGSVRIYDEKDLLPMIPKMFGRVSRGDDDEILVCGDKGLVSFHPGRLAAEPPSPQLAITDWKFSNNSVAVSDFTFQPHGPAGMPATSIRGYYNSLTLDFSFAALDYNLPEKNQYAYKLDGYDKNWIPCGNRHSAAYADIPSGKYVFRVIGANSAGIWNRVGASFAVVFTPPLWKQGWFMGLVLLALLLAAYFPLKRHVRLLAFWKKRMLIGQYRIVRPLGSGGMATVYLAHQQFNKNNLVAIKLLHEAYALDPISQKRFRQEGAIIDQLDHPHIVKILERGMQDDRLYIVMEYLPGTTLDEKLKSQGAIPLEEWLQIMSQLADVLVKIHGHGIIHRDLKPGNVMLLENGDQKNFVKVLDFGVARQQFQTTVTEWGSLLGTIMYIAPEQISQSLYIPAGDIYALGMIGYEMLAGRHPFAEKSSLEMIQQILSESPVDLAALRPEIPPGFVRLIMRLIARDPSQRPDAETLLDELLKLASLRINES